MKKFTRKAVSFFAVITLLTASISTGVSAQTGNSTYSGVYEGKNITINDGSFMEIKDDTTFKNCNITIKNSKGQHAALFVNSGKTLVLSNTKLTISETKAWKDIYLVAASSKLIIKDHSVVDCSNSDKNSDGSSYSGCIYSDDNNCTFDLSDYSKLLIHNNCGTTMIANSQGIVSDNSELNISNNKGSATNTGNWEITDSKAVISNNSGHGFSCNSIIAKNSTLVSEHNGLLGIFVSQLKADNCAVDVSCNAYIEAYLNYYGDDIQIKSNGKINITDCSYCNLGGINGFIKKQNGINISISNSNVNGYITNENNVKLTDNSEFMYKGKLFKAYSEKEEKFNDILFSTLSRHHFALDYSGNEMIGKDAKFLQDNKVNVATLIKKATTDELGMIYYPCVSSDAEDNCDSYIIGASSAVFFDKNSDNDVSQMPDSIYLPYDSAVSQPRTPSMNGYKFNGWFTDKECTNTFDFSQNVKEPVTLYAGWTKSNTVIDIEDNDIPLDNNTSNDITIGNSDIPTSANPQTNTSSDFTLYFVVAVICAGTFVSRYIIGKKADKQ